MSQKHVVNTIRRDVEKFRETLEDTRADILLALTGDLLSSSDEVCWAKNVCNVLQEAETRIEECLQK